MTTERDLRNQMAYAKKEAIEEGLAEGRAQGRAEGQRQKAIEIARKLLAAGYPKEEVMELTGVGADDM